MDPASEKPPHGVERSKGSLELSEEKVPSSEVDAVAHLERDDASIGSRGSDGRTSTVPWSMKIISVLLITAVGFGGKWSGGVTGAMKSTLKRELNINNSQYAVLEASEDFIKTVLILFTGLLTDRIGGAGAMLWGNVIYSAGAILIAAATTVRSYKFMIFGFVVQALGDVATQIAQFKVFSSWFAPSNGFASTLSFEIAIGKVGTFVGKSTANIIAKKTGDFSWVYWTSVFMNIFTNVMTVVFWYFTKYCERRFSGSRDPATGERLTERSRKFEWRKMLLLPWPFWGFIAYTAFQTTVAAVFYQNATEFAEKRFGVSAIAAGWYSSMSQFLGFFLVPIVGLIIDFYGQRLTIMVVCGAGMFLAMCLARWGPSVAGTAASFGVYAFANNLGPTVIIDGIRTTMWYQEVFGSAYAVKVAVNNAMTIIVRIVAGVIQDRDDDSYDGVVVIYVLLAAGSLVVSLVLLVVGFFQVNLGMLQWTRKKRIARGNFINKQKEKFHTGAQGERNRKVSTALFSGVIVLIVGSWVAYFWGIATGTGN